MNKVDELLRILMVAECATWAEFLKRMMHESGCAVVAQLAPNDDLYARVSELRPDAIILNLNSPNRHTLDHLCSITQRQPRPIVLFTSDENARTIRAAMRAGVSAYVVNGFDAQRIRPILDAALAQFEAFHAIRCELEQAKATLTERKLIGRARALLMEQCKLSEDEVDDEMLCLAVSRKMSLAELARNIIAATNLLEPVGRNKN